MDQHTPDPMTRLAREAEQKVIAAGIAGGDAHDQVDQTTINLAFLNWAIRSIQKSNAELAERLAPKVANGKRDLTTKTAPAGGIGFGLGPLVPFLRDLFGGG